MREFKGEADTSFNGRKGGGGGGGDTPLITPTTPTVPNLAPPPATKAIQIDTVATETGGYSAVNVLSILPDEVRTEENLEGGSLPPEQAGQMMQDYNKQRREYEERQLSKMDEAAATAVTKSGSQNQRQSPPTGGGSPVAKSAQSSSAVKVLSFNPGYEDVEAASPGYDMVVPVSKSAPATGGGVIVGGEYEDPADAVAHEISIRQLSRGGVKGAVVAPKSQISPDKPKKFQMTASLNERYTDVYNPGDGETIGQPKSRAMSESAANNTRIVNGHHQPHHYQNTLGGGATNSSGESLDDVTHQPFDRKEPIRGSKHKSAKEEVEFDPTARKVFRVTSTKKKQLTNGKDYLDGGESNGDSSPESKKEKGFNLLDEQNGEEYSMVNVADKARYRTEDDMMKKEGSGVPQRYSAAKSPLKEQAAA